MIIKFGKNNNLIVYYVWNIQLYTFILKRIISKVVSRYIYNNKAIHLGIIYIFYYDSIVFLVDEKYEVLLDLMQLNPDRTASPERTKERH